MTSFDHARSLVIFPTYQCNAMCSDCGTFSSPSNHHVLSREHIFSAIREAKSLHFQSVVLSGGEATLQWQTCAAAIRFATSEGMSTRLVTNGRWATGSESEARAAASELKAAGLTEMNVSTGDQHVRFVPLIAVARAAAAAFREGISTLIVVEAHSGDGLKKQHVIDALPPDAAAAITVIEGPWMPMRWPEGATQRSAAISAHNVAATQGCDSVLSSYVAAADGRIGACCGLGMRATPELNVGRIGPEHALEEAITNAEADFLKIWLSVWGPHRILAWAAQFDDQIQWENRYVHRCHACMAMYKDQRVRDVLLTHAAKAVTSVVAESLTSDCIAAALQTIT
jgi:hypothetical protein